MEELKILLEESKGLTDAIYYEGIKENFEALKNHVVELIQKLNHIFPMLMANGYPLNPVLLQKAEILLEALNKLDSILLSDTAEFEIKPILEEYLESIGD